MRARSSGTGCPSLTRPSSLNSSTSNVDTTTSNDMPSSTRKSPPPHPSPPLSPSDVPAVKSPQEPRPVSLFLPSPSSSSPPRPVESATVPLPSTGTSIEHHHLHLLSLIAGFLRSDSFRYGSVDLEITSVSPEAHRALLHEQESPRILTGKEADSLRQAPPHFFSSSANLPPATGTSPKSAPS